MSAHEVELCILGAGTAGYSAALAARELGKSVALVDGPGEIAGLCILRGCMPAKTVLETAEVARVVDDAATFGVNTTAPDIDPVAVVQRKRELVREFQLDRLAGIAEFPLFRGPDPHFESVRTLRVGNDVIDAASFLIATGSKIVPPDWPGLRESGFITSTEALELQTVPKTLIVLGGGPVGCEFAQYFARLGARVTLVQEAPNLLMLEDADLGAALQTALESESIEVLTGARTLRIERPADSVRVSLQTPTGVRTLEANVLMLATGRRPNVEGFGFEAAFVQADERGVRTDQYLRTTSSHIFAAGDVIGRRCLVHMAEYGGRIAARNALLPKAVPVDFDLYECRSVNTHPEVAVAGLTEADCRAREIPYEVVRYPFSEHGRAVVQNLPEGFVKMIAAKDGRILGIAFIGGDAGNLIHEATTLLYFRATVADVVKAPHLHPTMAEIITYPAEALSRRLGLHHL